MTVEPEPASIPSPSLFLKRFDSIIFCEFLVRLENLNLLINGISHFVLLSGVVDAFYAILAIVRYLKYLFKHLPEAMTKEDFIALLPQNIDKSLLESPLI